MESNICTHEKTNKCTFSDETSTSKEEVRVEAEYFNKLHEHDEKQESINLKFVTFSLIPNVLNCMIYYLMGFIEAHFIGKTKDLDLVDGLALGILYNTFQYSLLIGLIETVLITVPKNFAIKNYDLICIQIFQTRMIVFFTYLIFVIINFFFAMDILNLVAGEQKPYVQIAYKYVMYTMSSTFFDLNSEIYNKSSEAQMFFSPVTVSLVISSITMYISSYIFVYQMNLGIVGCGISSNITLFFKLISIIIYLKIYNPHPESDKCCVSNMFQDFWTLIKISFFSMISYFSEYSFSLITGILSNNLSETLYAKQIILSNVGSINYSFSYGWMNTACILISKCIGENSRGNFIKSLKYLFYLGIVVETIICIIFFFLRSDLFFFFNENKSISQDDDMLDYYIYLLILGCVLEFFQNFLFGVLRACGAVTYSAILCTVSFMLIHPVLASFLALKLEMNLTGIFISECAVKILLLTAWLSYMLFKLNIDEILHQNKISEKNETLL